MVSLVVVVVDDCFFRWQLAQVARWRRCIIVLLSGASWNPRSSTVPRSSKSRSTTSSFNRARRGPRSRRRPDAAHVRARPCTHCETALSLLADVPTSLVPESVHHAGTELVDSRTVLPWDVESSQPTGQFIIVHEMSRTVGVGAESAAEIQSNTSLKLHAVARRVTG